MVQDPLHYLPLDKWTELQRVFRSDWPRGVMIYNALETQRRFIRAGFDYGFKVFIPYGDVWNGIVAINEKGKLYEVIIQCPRDDTKKLEDALRKTEIINWKRSIWLSLATHHIIECIKKVLEDVNVKINLAFHCESFMLDIHKPLFEDVSLPPEIAFDVLTLDHVDFVDSNWPHRYPTSLWLFELLIKTKSGYGLFKNNNLVAWVLINEVGNLTHMYTVEEYRRKGYAELLLKLVSNVALREKRYLCAFGLRGNENACRLFKKVGFEIFNATAWWYLD